MYTFAGDRFVVPTRLHGQRRRQRLYAGAELIFRASHERLHVSKEAVVHSHLRQSRVRKHFELPAAESGKSEGGREAGRGRYRQCGRDEGRAWWVLNLINDRHGKITATGEAGKKAAGEKKRLCGHPKAHDA